MPSIVGPVCIAAVNGGSVQFGDVLNISPKNAAKSVAGSGGDNVGLFVNTNNLVSNSNVSNIAGIDQPLTGNV